MSKTINQALKDLYLSLGGDPSALEDNSTVSDYIADLENGLKGLAELPAPSSDNSGKIAKVVSDGEGGYIWGAENETSELPAPAVGDIGKIVGAVSDGESGAEYGLIDKPSDIYRFSASFDKTTLQWTIPVDEATNIYNAISAGKTIIGTFTGLSDFVDEGSVDIVLQRVVAGASSSFAGFIFTAITYKSSDVYAVYVYVMGGTGYSSVTHSAVKLVTEST